MNNVSTANETVQAPPSWCYTAKALEALGTAAENNTAAGRSLMMAPADLGIQPYRFTQPFQFTARENAGEMDKQLHLTRMVAFGRSLTAESWG
jgi:hypothetical protein